jgi:hypothetical protein
MNETETSDREQLEITTSMTATKVRNAVHIKERRGNLYQSMFINYQDLERMLELFEDHE